MTFKDAASAVATLGNSDDEATKISVINAIGAAMTSSADVSAHAEITRLRAALVDGERERAALKSLASKATGMMKKKGAA